MYIIIERQPVFSFVYIFVEYTVCPWSSDPFYVVSYYITVSLLHGHIYSCRIVIKLTHMYLRALYIGLWSIWFWYNCVQNLQTIYMIYMPSMYRFECAWCPITFLEKLVWPQICESCELESCSNWILKNDPPQTEFRILIWNFGRIRFLSSSDLGPDSVWTPGIRISGSKIHPNLFQHIY